VYIFANYVFEIFTGGSNMLELPNEILAGIFSYVPTRDLLLNVARVSKYFYELTLCSNQHVAICETIDQEQGKIVNLITVTAA
jgi:hypothetical protein